MNERTKSHLLDIAKIVDCEHKTAPCIDDGGIYSIRTTDIFNGRIDFNTANRVSESTYGQWTARAIPSEGDIVLAREAPVGEVGWIPKNKRLCLGQRVVLIRPHNNSIDPRYLCYFLSNPTVKYELISRSTGSVVEHLNVEDIRNFEIEYPPLPEQRAIAAVLSSLDDKIDLLHRQNKTLEGLAATLWRKMFSEDANPNWEKGNLGDFCDVRNGYAFESASYQTYQPGFLEVLKMGHIQPGGGLRSNPKRDFVSPDAQLKRWILNKGDIVLAMTDMKDNVVILGNPALIDKDQTYVQNQRVARITIKEKSILQNCYILYLQMKDEQFIAELQSRANSGVQVNLTTEAIKSCEILVPPYDKQTAFSHIAIELFNKFDTNTRQSRTLSALRDSLLPKLMSGEVRVKV